jgi:hypothetical protein
MGPASLHFDTGDAGNGQMISHHVARQHQQSFSYDDGSVHHPLARQHLLPGQTMLNQHYYHEPHGLQQAYQQPIRALHAQVAYLVDAQAESQMRERLRDALTEQKMKEDEEKQTKLRSINEHRRLDGFVPMSALPRDPTTDYFGKRECPERLLMLSSNQSPLHAGLLATTRVEWQRQSY